MCRKKKDEIYMKNHIFYYEIQKSLSLTRVSVHVSIYNDLYIHLSIAWTMRWCLSCLKLFVPEYLDAECTLESNDESRNLIKSLADIDSDSSDRWNLAANPDRPRLPQPRSQLLPILIDKNDNFKKIYYYVNNIIAI